VRFAHFDMVFLFFLLPVLFALIFYSGYRRRRAWKALADESLRSKLMPTASAFRVTFKNILKTLAFVFVVLALMEPQWGTREEEVKVRGVDMMVLVDVSNSMLAQDVPPSRLERAKRKLRDLIDMLAGDRVGLIAFAGRSFLLSPLTTDYGTLSLFIDELNTQTIPVQGTDLAGALELASKAMTDKDSAKAILVISDGEDHSERLDKMVQTLKEKGIKVFVLGVGTPQGAPVPNLGGGFKTDPAGKTVVSQLGESALKELAVETGGAYARTVTGDDDLKELYLKGVRGVLDLRDLKVAKKQVWESRFYWPLGAAALLLLLERLIPEARRAPKNGNRQEEASESDAA
jgi:26S proteasome regulatory complex, subunit RPN10/PSMD4